MVIDLIAFLIYIHIHIYNMETTLWVLGTGPLIVHKQFIRDISRRRQDWFLDDTVIPRDPRAALLLLYERCGNNYFLYSKYLNQTMGNMMFDHVKRLHWCDYMRAEPGSYIIQAHTLNEKRITAHIVFLLFDECMHRCGAIHVQSWFNIEKNETCIKVNDINL